MTLEATSENATIVKRMPARESLPVQPTYYGRPVIQEPVVYNLPPDPVVPTRRVKESWACLPLASMGLLAAAIGAVLGHTE